MRRHNVERISQGVTGDADELPAEHLRKLINGLKQLKRKRLAGSQQAPAAS